MKIGGVIYKFSRKRLCFSLRHTIIPLLNEIKTRIYPVIWTGRFYLQTVTVATGKSADYEALLMTRDGDISCLAAPRPTWVLLFYLEIKVKRSGVVWKR